MRILNLWVMALQWLLSIIEVYWVAILIVVLTWLMLDPIQEVEERGV